MGFSCRFSLMEEHLFPNCYSSKFNHLLRSSLLTALCPTPCIVVLILSCNRLKDSDVTWLYGPLHIGSDWSKTVHPEPPSKPSIRRQNSAESVSSAKLKGKKPILKHRSISELLSLPQSPFFAHDESDDECHEDATHAGDMESPSRPPLMHTKSDTHISWRSRPFRKNSPPRIIAPESPVDAKFPSTSTTTATSSDISNSTSSSQDFNSASSSGADGPGGKKKHISFNTFVEQYIAIEKPKSKRKGSIHFYTDPVYEDGSVPLLHARTALH